MPHTRVPEIVISSVSRVLGTPSGFSDGCGRTRFPTDPASDIDHGKDRITDNCEQTQGQDTEDDEGSRPDQADHEARSPLISKQPDGREHADDAQKIDEVVSRRGFECEVHGDHHTCRTEDGDPRSKNPAVRRGLEPSSRKSEQFGLRSPTSCDIGNRNESGRAYADFPVQIALQDDTR